MRILLLVAEAWREDRAGGNVIDNLFQGMDAEYAQVYCDALMPHNDICKKYFQITRSAAVKSFFSREPVGRELVPEDLQHEISISRAKEEDRKLNVFRKHRWNILITVNKIVLTFCNWKSKNLEKFILDFNPDVIFAPCYASPFMQALTRYTKDLTGKGIITYSGDDNYSFRQFSFSPFFWINRVWDHFSIKKSLPFYDVFYSMSEDEIKEMTSIVKKEMKILRKGAEVKTLITKNQINKPIRLIYAGGIYINRWKVLAAVIKALQRINKSETVMTLDIYTNNCLTKKQNKILNDGIHSRVHSAVDKQSLQELYRNSDIAIHVESFSLKNRYSTRLSFSTKIIDCLSSSCAVMAIAWKEQTGLRYLQQEEAAICITNPKKIENELRSIIDNPERIIEYSERARLCCEKNHNIKDIQNNLRKDFSSLERKYFSKGKVGLLTYHATHNYGATLQAYALAKTVEDLGYTVNFIDYMPPIERDELKVITPGISRNVIISNLRNILYLRQKINRKKNFDDFSSEFIKKTRRYEDPSEINEENLAFDIFLIGSDQTFNLLLRGDSYYRTPFFFPNIKKPKIAYAPSMGEKIAQLCDEDKVWITEQLRRFSYLTVREKKAGEFIENLGLSCPPTVLDPTLLQSEDIWNSLVAPVKHDRDYIFFYTVLSEPWVVDLVKKFSQITGLKVYAPHFQNQFEWHSGFERISDIGPREFLYMIKNAKYIITTSFHATVFSLIFKKEFFPLVIGEGNRIKSLMASMGLEDSMIFEDSMHDLNAMDSIEYNKVYNNLNKLRDESKMHLQKALDIACREKISCENNEEEVVNGNLR